MNIIEAIKSGKLHKRKSQREWCHPRFSTNETDLAYSIEDILADDWEIEEVRITISASDLKVAWIKACKSSGYHDDFASHGRLYAELKKELGL